MIIYIKNHKYDITEFVNEHPGGVEVFKNGADLTKEFNEVGHSKDAIKLLNQYLVKDNTEEPTKEHKEKEGNEHVKKQVDLDEVSVKELFLHRFSQTKLSRLFTKEDKANIHKILGAFAILNYGYFFFDIAYSGCKGKMTLRKKDANLVFSIVPLICLSLSAIMFHVPTQINKINNGMPEEYRFHSILFAMRSFIIITLITVFGKNSLTKIAIICILFLTMYLADVVTHTYKDHKLRTGWKVTEVPYWPECPVYIRNTIKKLYVVAQLSFTAWAFDADVEIHLAATFLIQITALLFTLLRKEIIKIKHWHLLYLAEYALVFMMWLRTSRVYKQISIGAICYIARVYFRINKYALWGSYAVVYSFLTNTQKDWFVVLSHMVILVSVLFLLNSKNMIQDPPRETNNNIVIRNTKHARYNAITIRLATTFNYYPGQYFNLFFNDDKRPYTPIHVSGQQANFFIKNYENGKISPNICKYYYEKGDVNVLGPFGNKYYDPEKDALMIQDKEITPKKIIMFCCGTGITPFYSILTNLSKNTKYKCKLYASFKSKEDRFLIQDIPKKKAKKQCFYSKTDTRLTKEKVENILMKNKKSVVLICGTNSYNKLIQSCCINNKQSYYIW